MSVDLYPRWAALVAAGRARWCPGMRVAAPGVDAVRIVRMAPWPCVAKDDEASDSWVVWSAGFSSGYAPDWTDPATLGCGLGLVREVWQAPHATTQWWGGRDGEPFAWGFAGGPDALGECHGGSEAEALIAALEAAKEGA